MYKPPFDISNKMLSLCISITEKIGKINSYQSLKRMPILRKNNKIKSIHSSLAIEANSLSLNQVKDVIAGKIVIGPQNEIQEVKNAYKVYNMMSELDCFKENDFETVVLEKPSESSVSGTKKDKILSVTVIMFAMVLLAITADFITFNKKTN